MNLGRSLLTAWLGLASGMITEAVADSVEVVVGSGKIERRETPLKVDIDVKLLGNEAAKSLSEGPTQVKLQEFSAKGEKLGEPFDGQLDLRKADAIRQIRLTFLLHGTTAPNSQRTFRFDPLEIKTGKSPWTFTDPSAGALDLKHGDNPVFRYNLAPVSNPKYPKIPARDAYLHPAFTPSGALITGDFSTSHPHHRGFFLAYTKTVVGDLHPDFWNYQNGSGLIKFDQLESAVAGPVTARILARHRWEANSGGTVLKEGWEIEAFDIPGSPYWVFDLTSRQRASGKPLEVVPYRYGGMAYRGPEPFYHGKIDVLTSEGLDRVSGDQKAAKWVDLTGPVAEGSSRFGGAMILDHPSNPNYPTVARIHPTTIPFFTFTPGHDIKLTIGTDADTTFRYRVVIHDGRPDRVLNDRLWNDFAEPPVVTVATKGP